MKKGYHLGDKHNFHAKCKEEPIYCPDHGVYRVLFVNFDRMLPPIDGSTKATSKQIQ